MSFSNAEVQKLIKAKSTEIEEAINSTEKELHSDEFDKAKLSFKFARIQQLFVELSLFMKNQKYI